MTPTELQEIKHDVNQIRQDFRNIEALQGRKIDELTTQVNRLITLLEGDQSDRERGFIPRMIALEKFMGGIKDTKTYLMGNIASAIFIITFLGGVITCVIKAYHFLKEL